MGESTGINKKTGKGTNRGYDPGENRMFTRRQIYQLMLPLIIEQLLTVTVGIADSMMVSVAGEAAVSGVSLVDAINNLVLSVLAALAHRRMPSSALSTWVRRIRTARVRRRTSWC